VDYKTPVDYSNLNQAELQSEAEFYYDKAIKSGRLDNDMTQAMNLYSLLSNAYPDNIIYALKLGKLYETIGKDRYAKGQYYRAMGINQSRPEPYYYLGSYFFSKEQLRKALKYYNKAYEYGYSNHYQMLNDMGIIYKKLGDTEKSLQYLQCASTLSPNPDLDKTIKEVKNANDVNKEYYRK
jgi:tetratricopeptide (TPR) repeat protein